MATYMNIKLSEEEGKKMEKIAKVYGDAPMNVLGRMAIRKFIAMHEESGNIKTL